MKHEIVNHTPRPLPRVRLELEADEFLAFAALYSSSLSGVDPLRDRIAAGLTAAWADAFPGHKWGDYTYDTRGNASRIRAAADRLARNFA